MRHRLFFAQIGESEDKSLLCGVNTGQYFDIKIDYVDITEEEIMRQIESLKFNNNNE